MNLRFQINRAWYFYKNNGFFRTCKKILIKINSRIFGSSMDKKMEKEEQENYINWIKENEPNEEELKKQREYKFQYMPRISIIVPMYNTCEKYLKELVESVVNQTYDNWELCLADGSEQKKDYVDGIVNADKRIKYIFLNENRGISGNSNAALQLANGDYIALLDHDDILPQFSLYEVVKVINENREAEFIYTDEDKIFEDKEHRLGPHFKPDYAPDTLTSYNYICHLSIFKRNLIERIGGFRKEFDGSQDYDLIFRAVEQANQVVHIPKILYHWRMNRNSVALSSDAKPYAYEAAKKAIASHIERIGEKAKVEDSSILGIYNVTYEVKGEPKVSIVIPNKNHKKDLKRCIDSVINKTTYNNYEIIIVENNSFSNDIFEYYEEIKKNKKIKVVKYYERGFNYSRINNYGVNISNGEFIIFLNNDTEIITENWIQIMLGYCQRKDVGIVGAKLLYSNQTVQHAGVVLGLTGVAGHINMGMNENDPGYMARNIITQNYSAVTGALLMISRNDFDRVGGFDEEFPVAYNDVDLCLKIRAEDKVVVMIPSVKAYHFESKTRGYENSEEKIKRLNEDSNRLRKKWKNDFKKGDPYFNPNFRSDTGIMRIKTNKNNKKMEKNEMKSKGKKTLFFIIALIITAMFFTYGAVITWDSSHYLWLTSLLTKKASFSNWDVVRGPVFPIIIRFINIFFGESTSGLLVGMFVFYALTLVICYCIYRDTVKTEQYITKKMKILLLGLFLFFIALNPFIFGYYHTLLTEFVAITFSVLGCYLAWKWIEIDFYNNKGKYCIYTLIFAILTTVAWFLKQPYVGTIFFPIVIASIISLVRSFNIRNFTQRALTILVCISVLIVGLKTWGKILEVGNVKIEQTRTSSGSFSKQVINGITEFEVLDKERFNTGERISSCEKFSENDKGKLISIINNNSKYKSFEIINKGKDYYDVIYLKGESISIGEAINYWIKSFFENPIKIIKSYFYNYLATISVNKIEFEGSRIINTKKWSWTSTVEMDVIGLKIYDYGNDTVFYLSEDLEEYASMYRGINRPIVMGNYLMRKLQLPNTVLMKVAYLILPLLTLYSVFSLIKHYKRYSKKFTRIMELIVILFSYSLMHIVLHSILGAIIDRYTMPAMITTFMGIFLSLYAITYRKKYKIIKREGKNEKV